MKPVSQLLQEKLTTPENAVKIIKSGQRVFVGSGCAEPQILVSALVDRAPSLSDIEIIHLLTMGIADYVNDGYMRNFRHNALFIGPNVRKAVSEGRADYTPIFLSEIPRLLKSRARPDVTLIQVAPPDKHGYCSMGMNVDIQAAAFQAAGAVLVEINPAMPRTHGAGNIHLNDITYCVESSLPLLELPEPKLDEVSERIGNFVSRLVEDGSCIQAGIGAVPSAALRYLTDKKDLGIHTEMFTDGLLPLFENGNITNKYKATDPGKTITSFVMGTKRLYEFVDDNPGILFYPSDYVNDPRVISRNDKVAAINSALQMDLTGQVCADSIGYRFYSGIGGQVDFIRGAAMSRGGKPIIAFPSTAKGGTISRITARLDEGAGVVTSRGDVHYAVTEYGVAYLHGKTIRERALALINIAHPDFRKELLDFVKEKHYVYLDEYVWQKDIDPYPLEIEHCRIFGDKKLYIRPLKPTDERLLQEFFYSHKPETIFYRHFGPKKTMGHSEAAELCCVDYDRRMALGVFDVHDDTEKIVGVARYSVNGSNNMAETAVTIHEDFRRLGIATHLLETLESYARSKHIEGFYSEIHPDNMPMLSLRKKQGFNMKWNSDEKVYMVEHKFDRLENNNPV